MYYIRKFCLFCMAWLLVWPNLIGIYIRDVWEGGEINSSFIEEKKSVVRQATYFAYCRAPLFLYSTYDCYSMVGAGLRGNQTFFFKGHIWEQILTMGRIIWLKYRVHGTRNRPGQKSRRSATLFFCISFSLVYTSLNSDKVVNLSQRSNKEQLPRPLDPIT